jgi:hypothetical protein
VRSVEHIVLEFFDRFFVVLGSNHGDFLKYISFEVDRHYYIVIFINIKVYHGKLL